MLNLNTSKTLILMLALICVGAGIGISLARQQQKQTPPDIPGLMWPGPKILGPFTTTDHSGNEFSLQNLKGKWSFLFFGYTHCPDVCPITLSQLNQVYSDLHTEDVDKTQIVFVSVDTDRDTTEQLKTYVTYFNADFIGLGGSQESVQSLTKQMGIAYYYDKPEDDGDYLVDHSAAVFLIDPQGQMVAVFSAPHDSNDIVSRYSAIRSFIEQQESS